MKRLLFAGVAMLVVATAAWALQNTPTPIVNPPETGEFSGVQDQVVDMARLKVGSGTLTAGGSATAATGTLNFASGVVTWPANLTIISNATATLTLTNSKVQAGDVVFGMIDSTGAAAGSVPEVASVQVSAGQVVFVLTNASATSPAIPVKVYYLVVTKGNPN